MYEKIGKQQGRKRMPGAAFDKVMMCCHSSKPVQLRAHVHTKGNRMYVRPGKARFPEQSQNTSEEVVQCELHPSFDVASYVWAENSYELGEEARGVARDPQARNSDILRASLVDDNGVPDSNSDYSGIVNQAHHIVEVNNNEEGGGILEAVGIDINSAANGVLLPQFAVYSNGEDDSYDTGNASIHNGSHRDEYRECVTRALHKAINDLENSAVGVELEIQDYRNAVLRVLAEIRRVLLEKNVPLNHREDPNYNDNTDEGETITEIFQDEGLI